MLLARDNFSLKRIKTYFCSTIINNWLNHLLILHTHKLLTDRHNLKKVTDKIAEIKKEENQNLDFHNV